MTHLTVILRSGAEITLPASPGLSVMEILRNSGKTEIEALCGGCCSCATCHIYIAPRDGLALPDMSDDERDLLEFSEARNETSRLACQIPFNETLDGLVVTVAPEV